MGHANDIVTRDSSSAANTRYRLTLTGRPVPALCIVDRWIGMELLRCSGDTARYIAAKAGLNPHSPDSAAFIDKATLKHLSLAVTARRLDAWPSDSACERADDRLLLRLMRDCCGVHFTAATAKLLLDFHGIDCDTKSAAAALFRLEAAGCVAAVDVHGERYFDTDTRPHWHVYVDACDELRDLELTGDHEIDARVVRSLAAQNVAGLHFVHSQPPINDGDGAAAATGGA